MVPERRVRASVRAVNCGDAAQRSAWGPAGGFTAVGWSAQRATDTASANTKSERRTNNMRISKGSRVPGNCEGDLTAVILGVSIGPNRSICCLSTTPRVGISCHLSSPKLARNESR